MAGRAGRPFWASQERVLELGVVNGGRIRLYCLPVSGELIGAGISTDDLALVVQNGRELRRRLVPGQAIARRGDRCFAFYAARP